jgi:glyoxylase-like metal-dependent hydrolase (beta-lactamase superfamily II)
VDFVLEQIRTGGDRNLGYLVGDRVAGVAVAVDPSYEPDAIAERARAQSLRITHILNTHGHVDHAQGNLDLKQKTGARIAAYKDSSVQPEQPLDDGDVLRVGSIEIRVLHVPGHCPDHLLFHLPDQKVAITGDLLFVGKIGGTSTDEDARVEYDSLQRVLSELPDETTIWPGHDYGCRPASTIALERLVNPFLQTRDLQAFLHLKRDWADFKARHGLV